MDFTTTHTSHAPSGVDFPATSGFPIPVRSATEAPPSDCSSCRSSERCLAAGLGESENHCLGQLTIGRRRVRKGQTVYRQGERFLFMYAVRFGTLKSVLTMKNGCEQVTAFHLPGEMLGIDAAGAGKHPTTLTALEDAEVCAIPYTQLADAAADLRSLRMGVMQMAGAELVREQRLLALIANSHSEERVAAFLMNLSERMQERGFSSSEFLLRMTRAEIGSYLGTTLETVSRSLSAFARRGYIKVRRRRIQLVDTDSMMAEFETALP
jgi:CRP/FNR family transcriptional regulator, anaerobic regulatory protein